MENTEKKTGEERQLTPQEQMQALTNMHQQNQHLQKQNQQLYQEYQRITSVYVRIDYLLQVLSKDTRTLFSTEFVDNCVSELEGLMTALRIEKKDLEEETKEKE